MPQQINLYNPALRLRREWLSLSSVAAVALLLATVLLAAGGVLRWQARALEGEMQTLDARLAGESARLVTLSAQPGAAAAKQELATLQQQVAARREVLAALRAGAGKTESTAGFADYLRGLARQSVGGLWLTGFSVAQGGDGMEIRGQMSEPAALPDYIRRLNAEQSFQGRRFVSLHVERSAENAAAKTPAVNSFVLTAVVAPEAGKERGAAR